MKGETFTPLWVADEDEADSWATLIAHVASHLRPEIDEIDAYLEMKRFLLEGPVDKKHLCDLGNILAGLAYLGSQETEELEN